MKKIINNFTHLPGHHCGSTSLSNYFKYHRKNFSEFLCFGLGSGINFTYFPMPHLEVPLFIGGRTSDLEIDFCLNIGVEVTLHSDKNYESAWEKIKEKIDLNEPVIVWVDTYYLPYFKTQYHFPMHHVIVIGYDDEEEVVYIADNERKEIQKVSYLSFRKARSSNFPPIPAENKWYEIKMKEKIKDIREAMKEAVKKTKEIMYQDESENLGIKGLKKFAKDLPSFPKIFGEKWVDAGKMAYLLFEKFGSGGGNFRLLYAKFLEESSNILKSKEIEKISADYYKIGIRWQEVANLIKGASKEEDQKLLKLASDKVEKIAREEEKIYNDIYDSLTHINQLPI